MRTVPPACSARRALRAAGLALLLAVAGAFPGASHARAYPAAPQQPAAAPAPRRMPVVHDVAVAGDQQLELVESVPVESGLGNPALPSALEVWLAAIRGAHGTLDLEEFYLSDWPGEPLHEVLEEIGRAARRGVEVRLLLDVRMHQTYPLPADSLGRLPNIHVRLLDMGKLAGGVQHAKFFVVDGHGVYLGSQNLDWRALEHIHELGVWINDFRLGRVFQELFDEDWERAGPNPDPQRLVAQVPQQPWYRLPFRLAQPEGDTVEVWPSYSPRGLIPDSTRWDRDALVRLLDSARHEIVMQSLTYSTQSGRLSDDALDQALRRAAARGVKVRMIISDWGTGKRQIEVLRSLAQVPNVEIKISTVPPWSGGYVPFARVEHCKYAVVDTAETWVGTSNWEPSYFHTTRNVAVILGSPRLAGQARQVFQASWSAPGAAPLDLHRDYPEKIHGETPPPGAKKYGE
ncbi:MAG TPA: phospholipase D-like domain-containing protein [Candidatus Saccharimonadales bacterium]|nr:phospholipase D-like domain-containing protein [Candidatus Saccharimonadales bacterium]